MQQKQETHSEPMAASVAFPLVELGDLLSMLKAKKFRMKAGLMDFLAIARFGVDQLPDDPADPVSLDSLSAAHAARSPMPAMSVGQALADLIPDLERLESIYTQCATTAPGDAQRGLFSGVKWGELLAKWLPLIISLFGSPK